MESSNNYSNDLTNYDDSDESDNEYDTNESYYGTKLYYIILSAKSMCIYFGINKLLTYFDIRKTSKMYYTWNITLLYILTKSHIHPNAKNMLKNIMIFINMLLICYNIYFDKCILI